MGSPSGYDFAELEFNLEKRAELIKAHKEEMAYVCKLLPQYVKDVAHTVGFGFSPSMVAHYTYNLALDIASALTGMTIYEYLYSGYLLGEDYDDIYSLWDEFRQDAQKIIYIIDNLNKQNYFVGENAEDVVFDLTPEGNPDKNADALLLNQECDISNLNGEGLLNTLSYYLRSMESWLKRLKMGEYDLSDDDYELIFTANYNLYRKVYWPQDGRNFREHTIEHYFRSEESQIEKLQELHKDEKIDFFRTVPGMLWRDYYDDKKELYYKMKDANLNEEQWKFFFMNICRFEEYERWIEELKNPPESDEDKQKRERLLKTNTIFNLDATNQRKKVDILLLYKFIAEHFLPIRFVYEWYALYFILKWKGVLRNCTTKEFADLMNDDEWFPNVEKKCKANEINTYGFLNDKAPGGWNVRFSPEGNRATKNSITNLARKHDELDFYFEEIYAVE